MHSKKLRLEVGDIDYVNVHGTSTPLGDISGNQSNSNLYFGDHSLYIFNISSTKSMTGHLLGAAGAVEAVACIIGNYRRELYLQRLIILQMTRQLDPKFEFYVQ